MKRLITLTIAGLISIGTFAQDLPKPSPAAKVEQRVGLTDITVTYSRPGVKGRTIWGDLVPYGEVWRAGANKATLFSTNSDIKVNGQDLVAGDYSIFMIPENGGDWAVIFNNETELWGAGNLNREEDALNLEVSPEMIENNTERLEYHFTDVNMKAAELCMDWAGMRITLMIEADPMEQAMKNITTALEEAEEGDKWKVYRTAASFAEDNNMTAEGLEWIKESVSLMENWYSYWVYAGLLAQNGENQEAIKKAEKAIEIGKKDAEANGDTFSYEDRILADIEGWK